MKPTPLQEKYLAAVAEICDGQPDALRWFQEVLELALLWDHIVDGDEIDRRKADAALQSALITWVHNPFYVRNGASLSPVLMNCLSAWKHGGRTKAYDLYTELPCTLALLFKGPAGVNELMPKIRSLVDQERWQDTRRDHTPFLIVGLPRSRTAWLAAFLTDGEVHCHHELIRRCSSLGDYVRMLHQTKAPIVGDADPSLPLVYGKLKDRIGPHKLVFIEREPAAAEAAHAKMLAELGPEFAELQKGWPGVVEAFEAMRAACPDTLTFKFDDLDKPDTVQQLAEYCTGLLFNAERWKLFDELKVVVAGDKAVRGVKGAKL